MSKELLREQMLRMRMKMERREIVLKSRKIAEHIHCIDDFKRFKTLALYSPIKNEVETDLIFQYAKNRRKKILYPRIEKNTLIFSAVNDLEELIQGKYGILEPPASARSTPIEEIEVFIIPGVAFDINGFRLGYGYGYYDSVVSKIHGILIGLAYKFQVVNNIFPTLRDIKVNMIITENGVINCTN